MVFRDRLIANLKVMMEQYEQRNIIAYSYYNVTFHEDDNMVMISYVLTCYDHLKNIMDKYKYDDYRSKLLHYCVRTAEMLTSSREVYKVIIEERVMDTEDIEIINKRMEIY